MSNNTLPQEIEKWSLLIGRFILAFNEIELATYKLWDIYFPGKQIPENFKSRVDKLIGIMKTHNTISKNGKDPVKMLINARTYPTKEI